MKQHFAQLQVLVQKQLDAQAAVEKAEADLKTAKDVLEHISTNLLPNYMQNELGMKELTLDDGTVVTNKALVVGSLAKERMLAAQKWCDGEGIKTLIREQLTVDIGPEAREKRDALVESGEAMGLPVSSVLAAHPQTVAKFVRERLEEGKNVPETIFNIHRSNKVTLKCPKN